MKDKKVERGARESGDIDYVVRVDFRKVQIPWYENVDLELLEAGSVTVIVPPQHLPRIIAVPSPDGVEVVVCLTKVSLDGLCTTWVRGEAKDVKVLKQKREKSRINVQ